MSDFLGYLGENEMLPHESLRKTSEPPSEEILVPKEAKNSFYLAMGVYVEDGIYGLWSEPTERMDGHRPDHLAITIGERFAELSNLYNGAKTQSPIEDMLAGALLWMDVDWGGMPTSDMFSGPEEWKEAGHIPSDDLRFVITPQARVAGHKVDFLLWFVKGRHIGGVAIECDGHNFHEKTKEQAARDKKRDREILAQGFPVLRFTGSEIFWDVIGCAGQIRDALSRPLDRVSKDSGLF